VDADSGDTDWAKLIQILVSNGHNESDIIHYSYDKIEAYIAAIVDLKEIEHKNDLNTQLEAQLKSRGVLEI